MLLASLAMQSCDSANNNNSNSEISFCECLHDDGSNKELCNALVEGMTSEEIQSKIESCNPESASIKQNENCIYIFDEKSYELKWTAYKFQRKAGVNGTFRNIIFSGNFKNKDVRKLIEGLSFAIPVNTIETNDNHRNEKIINYFFKRQSDTDTIHGSVKSLHPKSDEAIIKIIMNGENREVLGKYKIQNNTFELSSAIDVTDWNANEALSSLSKECNSFLIDFEYGDSKPKLWPDVSIDFKIKLSSENCIEPNNSNTIKALPSKSKCLKLFSGGDMSAWENAQAECLLKESKSACACMLVLAN